MPHSWRRRGTNARSCWGPRHVSGYFFTLRYELRGPPAPGSFAEAHEPDLLPAREPAADGIAPHGVEGGELVRAHAPLVAEPGLRPAAHPGVGAPRGGRFPGRNFGGT